MHHTSIHRLLLRLLILSILSLKTSHTTLPTPEDPPIIKLTVPCFDPTIVQVTRYEARDRAIHKGGPQINAERVDHLNTQYIKAKIEGSGANGISFALGSADEIYRKVFKLATQSGLNLYECDIAICGAGINGLWTAYKLLKQGISPSHLKIFAKEFENTTSEIAAGMLFPIPGSLFPDDMGQQIEEDSYHAWAALAHQQNPELNGVRELPLYVWHMSEAVQQWVKRGLIPQGEAVTIETQDGRRIDGVMRWTKGFYVTDPFYLMPDLRKKLKDAGVSFITRTFTDETEFFNLGARVFIVCLGIGNKELLKESQESITLSEASIYFIPHQEGVTHMFFGSPSGPFGYIPKGKEQGIVVRFVPEDKTKLELGKDNAKFLNAGWTYFGNTTPAKQ